jgi:NAD(P)-dependent dehydrogenase (short-subunit alcohol dehydrogenase family)
MDVAVPRPVTSPSVVLVTGASSGIGLATALRFARAGHTVAAGVRDLESATALRHALADAPGRTRIVQLDVASDDSVTTAVAEIQGAVGPIDVLVNNAGISMSAALETAPLPDARKIFEVNYFGMIRMIQAVLPEMRRRQTGTIINVSSISALVAVPALGHYAASKAALESATETLGQEVARFGIRVALIEPGVTETPMFTRRSNLRSIDPASPYLDDLAAVYQYFARGLRDPLAADSVAQLIAQVAASAAPQFRNLLGADAVALRDARRLFSDEEWIAGSPAVRAIRGGSPPPGEP